jgi:hypothetical protein
MAADITPLERSPAAQTQRIGRPGRLVMAQRILFIGGLHRSGTTPVARWVAQHPDASGLEGTGVAQDEGQHLQDVYPPAAAYGGPGRFALDPAAHLTETSPEVSAESRDRLWLAWSRHWDSTKPLLVEKSPPNLIRMRFLEALFPDEARFVMVVRHPLAVAYATRPWTRRFDSLPPRLTRRVPALQAGLDTLLHHWVVAHERFLADAAHVKEVLVARYEDVMEDPNRELGRIFRFAGLDPIESRWDVKPALNERYLARWHRARSRPGGRRRLDALASAHEARVAAFGYSLKTPERLSPPTAAVARYVTAGV